MRYDELIRDAWAITWRYRFLWILGLLAGAALPLSGGSGFGNGSTPQPQRRELQQPSNPQIEAFVQQLGAWASEHMGLLIAAAVIAACVGLVLVVVSFIAQGGMARATADIATGHPSSFRSAWAAGIHLFWRYVGLWLVLGLVALAIGVPVAVIVLIAVALVTAAGAPIAGAAVAVAAGAVLVLGFVTLVLNITETSRAPRWLIGVAAALFALPIFTVFIALALAVSIVVAFAQRAIAVEDIGPLDALRSGWRLLRLHLGETLLAWAVNIGIATATGLAAIAGVLGVFMLVAGVGAALFAVVGLTAPTFAYATLGGLLLLVVVLTLIGIANTFFWSYWTLAYLRLSGRMPAPVV